MHQSGMQHNSRYDVTHDDVTGTPSPRFANQRLEPHGASLPLTFQSMTQHRSGYDVIRENDVTKETAHRQVGFGRRREEMVRNFFIIYMFL